MTSVLAAPVRVDGGLFFAVEPAIRPGSLVSFMHRDVVCVGYVDSIDADTPRAANVVATQVHVGRWKAWGNPSLDVGCWRVPIVDLTPLGGAP
jgi:hypothetical protein